MCGGNDTCIHGNRGNAGRYRWIETGFGSCSVTCGVGNSVFNIIWFTSILNVVKPLHSNSNSYTHQKYTHLNKT